jgi:phosphoribosyl 1,2-cyclic phosphodiesterase
LPRLQSYLAAEEVVPSELTAIFVSHEHSDHCCGAADLSELAGVPVWANASVLRAAGLHNLVRSCVLDPDKSHVFGDVELRTFPVSHDAVQPVGFLIKTARRTITLATDLGEPTDPVREAVRQSDLVVLEANHDTQLLLEGRYPFYLRKRVAGPLGHLSNHQSGVILAQELTSERVDVWLAHLSKENNTPQLALRTVRSALRSAGRGAVSVKVALRDRPSLRWNGEPAPRQLSLFPALESA